jgi:glutamyl-tRNA synthetase
VKKRWKPESAAQLKRLAAAFEELKNQVKEEYESALHRTAEVLKVRNSELIHPLRLAVSGVGSGPGLYDILVILGRDETVNRINLAIEKLQ